MEDPPAVELSQDRARARTSSRREPRGIRENILSMLQINGIRQTRIRAKSSGNLAGQKQDFYEGISALCPLKLPVPNFAITSCLLSNNSHSCPSQGSYVIRAFHVCMCVCVNEIMSSSFLFSEQANKKGYWINELESLGISPKEIVENRCNNDDVKSNSIEELANLVENIKQTMYQEYKTVYSERLMQLEAEERAVVV